jgi:hypothetical protein
MQAAKPRLPAWLVIGYILSLLAIAAWPFVAFMSVFAFDAPGSAQDPAVWTTVIAVLSYPLLPLVGVPASFFSYRGNHRTLGYILAAVGAVPLAIILLALVAIFASSAAEMMKLRL